MEDLNLDVLPDMTATKQVSSVKRNIVEGKAMLRFVNYVEVGKHRVSYMGQEKDVDKVHLMFEVFGKNYPLENGQPMRITIKENYSLHEKSNFKKLFMMMRNGDESIKHMSQMLGQAFIGEIKKYKIGDNEYPTLKGEQGYKIQQAVVEDPETGEIKRVNVPEHVGPIRRFIWQLPSKKDWDSLYIDGTYNDGNSKNVYQNTIMSALNFQNSNVHMVVSQKEQKKEELKTKGYNPQNATTKDQEVENYFTGLDADIEF